MRLREGIGSFIRGERVNRIGAGCLNPRAQCCLSGLDGWVEEEARAKDR